MKALSITVCARLSYALTWLGAAVAAWCPAFGLQAADPVPPMTWCSWALYPNFDVSTSNVLAMARIMTNAAYRSWDLLEINDRWASYRDPETDSLVADPDRFPGGIAALAAQLHDMGRRCGLFYSLGPLSIGGMPGSEGYWEKDAADAAAMGLDMVFLVNDTHALEPDLIEASFRPFISRLRSNAAGIWVQGTYHSTLPAPWMADGLNSYYCVGKKPWGADTDDNLIHSPDNYGWSNMFAIVESILPFSYLVRPGHFFAAYLAGGGPRYAYQNQMGIAALLSMKTAAYSFPQNNSEQTACQTNQALISILKDPLCIPAVRTQRDGCDLFVKPLADGNKAIGVWCQALVATNFSLLSSDLGWPADTVITFSDVFSNLVATSWSGNTTVAIDRRQLRLFIASSPAAYDPLKVTLRQTAAGVELMWSTGTLYQGDQPGGPFSPVPGAVAPHHAVSPSATQRYYRVGR